MFDLTFTLLETPADVTVDRSHNDQPHNRPYSYATYQVHDVFYIVHVCVRFNLCAKYTN
jgi:hypothetical protein